MAPKKVSRWILATLMLVACRQIVGIDERSSGPSSALSISDNTCRACLGTSCAQQAEVCLADPDCKSLADCVLTTAKNDVAGRISCGKKYPTSAAYLSLDACVRASCLPACYGTGGLFSGLPQQCSSCLQTAAPDGCGNQTVACLADRSCEQACGQAYAEPGQMNPPSTARCGQESTIGDPTSLLYSCLDTCLDVCPLNESMDCVGAFSWPFKAAPTITLRGQRNLFQFSGEQGPPAAGVTVEACAPLQENCVPTAQTQLDEQGNFSLALDTGLLGGWRGYLRFSGSVAGEPIQTEYYFPGRPLVADHRIDPQILSTVSTAKSIIALLGKGSEVLPGRAQLTVIFLSCPGFILPPKVELSISPGAIVDEPDAPNNATKFNQFSTQATTTSFVFNARPGCAEITGKIDGKVTHRQQVVLFADALTSVILTPLDESGDPVFTCAL